MHNKPVYYWVVGLSEGKIVLDGSHPNESSAEQLAMEKGFSEYEIIKLDTMNTASATRKLKHMRLESSTLNEALERVRHTKRNESPE